jgi:hypothetical protein
MLIQFRTTPVFGFGVGWGKDQTYAYEITFLIPLILITLGFGRKIAPF